MLTDYLVFIHRSRFEFIDVNIIKNHPVVFDFIENEEKRHIHPHPTYRM